MKKALLPLSLVAALLAASAFADCPAPSYEVKIPDGNTATKDEMLAASHSIKAADAAVKDYGDCLRAEQDAKIAAGGDKMKDPEKQKIAAEYNERNNVEVEKLQKIADEFNISLRAWKAKQAPAT